VIFPGEAVVGLEAAAASLIAPGDVVLNLVSGVFGRAFGQTARQFATYPLGPVIGLVALGRALRRAGAAADVGAAVEAALGHDLLYPPA
jgi:pyridoxamine--pyruvate transaminase